MFKKKKETLFNSVDDERSTVYDFRLRITGCSFESYRPVEYRFYHKLDENEMIPKLDSHLDMMFAGSVDDANGDMLDELLFGAMREALPFLAMQRINHNDALRRFIVRRTADREDICRIRDQYMSELVVLQSDYEKICKAFELTEEVL